MSVRRRHEGVVRSPPVRGGSGYRPERLETGRGGRHGLPVARPADRGAPLRPVRRRTLLVRGTVTRLARSRPAGRAVLARRRHVAIRGERATSETLALPLPTPSGLRSAVARPAIRPG